MPLPDIDTVVAWRGRTVRDSAGDKIGTFAEIFLDADTDRPEWAALKTGLLGRRRVLLPLSEARDEGADLRVPFDKAHVEAAPSVEGDAELSKDEEARLYRHYGVDYSDEPSGSRLPAGRHRAWGRRRLRERARGRGEAGRRRAGALGGGGAGQQARSPA